MDETHISGQTKNCDRGLILSTKTFDDDYKQVLTRWRHSFVKSHDRKCLYRRTIHHWPINWGWISSSTTQMSTWNSRNLIQIRRNLLKTSLSFRVSRKLKVQREPRLWDQLRWIDGGENEDRNRKCHRCSRVTKLPHSVAWMSSLASGTLQFMFHKPKRLQVKATHLKGHFIQSGLRPSPSSSSHCSVSSVSACSCYLFKF